MSAKQILQWGGSHVPRACYTDAGGVRGSRPPSGQYGQNWETDRVRRETRAERHLGGLSLRPKLCARCQKRWSVAGKSIYGAALNRTPTTNHYIGLSNSSGGVSGPGSEARSSCVAVIAGALAPRSSDAAAIS